MSPAILGVAAAAAIGLAAAFGQSSPAKPETAPPTQPQTKPNTTAKPEAKPASPAATKPAGQPTLDELLGLPGADKSAAPTPKTPGKDGAEKAAIPAAEPLDPNNDLDRAKAELDRLLTPAEVSEQFEQAVGLMKLAAKRLESKDPGLQTQRVQDEVLRKLDKLIDDAIKRSNQQQSSSSQQQGQKQPQPQDQQQGAQQQQSAAQQESGQSERGDGRGGKPARQEGPGKPPPAAGSATWGNLPAHLREALQQGLSDRFSSRYRAKTEEYYKRLAEDRRENQRPGESGAEGSR